MPEGTKIATCCYCGTRAVLRLDRDRHELACSACGAPLHEMKALPVTEPRHKPGRNRDRSGSKSDKRTKRDRKRTTSREVPPHRSERDKKHARKPRKKPKKRKSALRWMMKELWDVVEDVFD